MTMLKTHINVREGALHAGYVPPKFLTSLLLMTALRYAMTAAIGSASTGTKQPDEIGGNIPAPALGGACMSQHAGANGAHAMSKLEGARDSIRLRTARRSEPAMRAALV